MPLTVKPATGAVVGKTAPEVRCSVTESPDVNPEPVIVTVRVAACAMALGMTPPLSIAGACA
jgi:hypothetical protein